MKRFLLFLILVMQFFICTAESWTYIGDGYWIDPFWVDKDNQPLNGIVRVEESNSRPNVYKVILREDWQVIIHCENQKVYMEQYSLPNANGDIITIIQLCEENGWYLTDKYGNKNYLYGYFSDNIVYIQGDYFIYYVNDNIEGRKFVDSNRSLQLTIPDHGDASLQSGIYFGITAFNYMPQFMPIQLIDGSNKIEYQQFVNSQEMDDYTYLYYSVDKAIETLKSNTYPRDLNSVAIITFTDGNDDGSLEKAPDPSWTDTEYQSYISNKIKNTSVLNKKLEAYSIGLKGEDIGDYNYELFKSNLLALASEPSKASEVNNMSEVEYNLNKIIDQLQESWQNKKVQVKINMRGTGDRIRFTLDKTRSEMNNNPENSNLWIEGVFSRDDLSLNDIVYHGFTSTSGQKVTAEQVSVGDKTKYQFTFENLRDESGELLKTGEINFWHKNTSTTAWQPHSEFGGDSDVKTETEYSSAAVMLVMDCSSSLGETDFTKLKNVVNSVIERLADKKSGVGLVTIDDDDAPVEYYNLNGIRVENPSNGIYIQRKGNKIKKILIR
ncbi:MAG: VWA domain-containing protein [Muribaculaceae bacterium]|nr:VWA domain-containing protein [Muribaculaceae bacterium]